MKTDTEGQREEAKRKIDEVIEMNNKLSEMISRM